MLSLIVFLPAAAALVLLAVPGRAPRAVFIWAWIAVGAAELALVVAAWAGYQPRGGFGWTEDVAWIPPRVSATTSAWTACRCR
jgi:NADH-quinone oxidoreductase subunit M